MDVEVFIGMLDRPVRVLDTSTDILGEQTVIQFGNGYGASIVRGPYTYGGPQGRYEVAVIKFEGESGRWELCYETPLTDDVIGWLSEQDVTDLARQIADLPPHMAVTP